MFVPACEKTTLLTLVGNGAVAEKLLAFIVNPVFGVQDGTPRQAYAWPCRQWPLAGRLAG